MKWMKVLYSSFLVAVMLLVVNACGVSSVTDPTATADPDSGASIQNSDAIVITFNVAMDSSTLVLSGDMADESDGGVWSNNSVTNGRLKISPSADSNDTWAAGERTLNIKVSSSSGAPLSLSLTYTVVAPVPTAVAIPASPATINGASSITVLFSTGMSIPTLVLSGDMAAEVDSAVTWSKRNNENDTLIIEPSSAWSGDATTLVINVDSAKGVPLPSFALIYAVDISIPVIAGESPPDNTTINGSRLIRIPFNIAMKRGTLVLSGTSVDGSANDGGVWSSTNNTDDTLIISPNGAWEDSAGAPRSIIINVDASNGNSLVGTLNYIVDTNFLINSVTPSTNNNITGNQPIIIDFGESADIVTLAVSGTLLSSSNGGSWSGDDSKLTFLPKTSLGAWPAGSIDLTLNIFDLVGNSLALSLDYLVDTEIPVITLAGANPQVFTVGDVYTELGATATDNIDDNTIITGNIVIDISAVNLGAVGSYAVTYNVSDAAGNPALEVTRTVNVNAAPDTEIPVITLAGANPQVFTVGDVYTELGATATDNIDDNTIITGNIVIDISAVNLGAVGSYAVTYNVSDAAGNPALEVTRTVNVNAAPDTEIPVITLAGANPQVFTVGDVYTELGATATDNIDDNTIITGNIVIDISAVNLGAVGSYAVTYNVSDAAGNPALEVTRTVNVNAAPDTEIPVITLAGANPQVFTVGDVYTELGATATDNIDDNTIITGNIVIDISAVNLGAVGSYAVTYNVSDAAGNPALEVTRTVNVNAAPDTEIPVITLAGANPQVFTVGDVYTELGATATDNIDDNTIITGNIVIDISAVNLGAVGSYAVTYNVSDAAGNPALEVTRTVNVNAAPDTEIPVITLAGANPQVFTVGDVYTELGATATDNIDDNTIITGNIVIDISAVNLGAVGSYAVTYNVSDAAGNPALEVTRTVNVNAAPDTEIPVITLAGANPQVFTVGDVYTELGATATDNIDDNTIITGNIVIDISAVNLGAVGSYAVTYNVSDAAGNPAATKTRTVNVNL